MLQARAARSGKARGQQVAKTLTTGGGGHAYHEPSYPPDSTAGDGEVYASAAVSRLEQGTKRLARQYEDLQREVLKLSTASADAAKQPTNQAPR